MIQSRYSENKLKMPIIKSLFYISLLFIFACESDYEILNHDNDILEKKYSKKAITNLESRPNSFEVILDKSEHKSILYKTKLAGRAEYYTVELVKKNLYFENLPEQFDGLKIGLLADLHVGYFEKQHLDKIYDAFLVDCKTTKQPMDMLFFLGDLVNYHYKEFDEERINWIKKFKNLTKYNLVLSILGNHDYNQYDENRFLMTKPLNNEYDKKMKEFQEKELHWKLLKNEHIILQKGGQAMKIFGLEHLGTCTSITNRGNIDKTVKNLNSIYDINEEKAKEIDKKDYKTKCCPFTIMLAHDPNYADWLPGDLILSGHTHGSKMLVDGIKKHSMSALFCENNYPSGLYLDKRKKKHLYVSKGVGLSGVDLKFFNKRFNVIVRDRDKTDRIPEVTIITLKKGKNRYKFFKKHKKKKKAIFI